MSYTPSQNAPFFCFYSNSSQVLVPTSNTTIYSSDSTDYALNQKLSISNKIGAGEIINNTDFVLHSNSHAMSDVRTTNAANSFEVMTSIRFVKDNTQIGTRGQDSCVREDLSIGGLTRIDEFAKSKIDKMSKASLEFYYTRGDNMDTYGLYSIEKQSLIFGILT